jgi:hypothetical protein
MVDSMLDDVGEQCGYLSQGMPDETTRARQCHRWPDHRGLFRASRRSPDLRRAVLRRKNAKLTLLQRQEVNRLAAQIPAIRELITGILALAEELKGGTIEPVLAKSDLELGLDFLLRNREKDK